MGQSSYNDSNLRAMIDELDGKNRVKALKASLRIAGNKVKKRAKGNLGLSVHGSSRLEDGLKLKVWKHRVGFTVTAGAGLYQSARFTGEASRPVPVLRWLETGTKERRTRRKMKFFKGSKSGHQTGSLRKYGYMAKTLEQEAPSVTAYLHDSIEKTVKRIAKKHGCK